MARVIPQEGEVSRGVGGGEPGADTGLDLGQAGVAPAGAALGGAEARVVGVMLLVGRQVGAPRSIQAVQREDANLGTATVIDKENKIVQFNFNVA